MKKIIRLTESDLIRIVKRVISEQKPDSMMSGQPGMKAPEDEIKSKFPEIYKMALYADGKMGSVMNRGLSCMKDKMGYTINTSSSSSLNPLADEDSCTFSIPFNGKTKVECTKSYGVDRTLSPLPQTFGEFKRWFDSNM